MRGFKLYLQFIKMNFIAGLQYKGWPLMVLQVIIVVITDPISLIFMFSRFGNIGVWSVERIILIYAMAVTSFGLAETFCRGFDYFPWKMIRTGDFDRVLLRPAPLFVQIAGSYFHIHRLSRVVGGSVAIIWSLHAQGIIMSLGKLFILISALIGGMFAYIGVFVFTSGIAFFTIKGLDWIYIFTNVSYQATRCPVDYMPKLMRFAYTFIMPVLVVSYYPASVICGWGESLWLGLLPIPFGLTFLLASLLVWRIGVRHYKSTGS